LTGITLILQPAILTRHKNGGQAAGKLLPRNPKVKFAFSYYLSAMSFALFPSFNYFLPKSGRQNNGG